MLSEWNRARFKTPHEHALVASEIIIENHWRLLADVINHPKTDLQLHLINFSNRINKEWSEYKATQYPPKV